MSILALPTHRASASGHFGPSNSVAVVARRFCRSHQLPADELLGGVACAEHWEEAIRRDAVFAAENGLPAEPPSPDPTLIDDVAVARAQRGEHVTLTPAEQAIVLKSRRADDITWGRTNVTVLCRHDRPCPAGAELAVIGVAA